MSQNAVRLNDPAKEVGKPLTDASAQTLSDEKTGLAAIPWFVPVESVEALLTNPVLGPSVKSGLVFVQNKRPMADLLVQLAFEVLSGDVKFHFVRESAGDAYERIDKVSLKRASRAQRSSNVEVIECDLVPTHIPAALSRLAAARGLRRGVWVCGHLRDFHPAQLRLFDTMFLFDMSDEEVETLRSAIPLPEKRISDMRAAAETEYPPERVLVFTAGSDRTTRERKPVVSGNPKLIQLGKAESSRRKHNFRQAEEL